MVEDRAVQPLRRASQTASGQTVGTAGARIAAGVIMPEDDPRACAPRRIGDDRADGQESFRFAAFVTSEVNAVQLLVDMCDEEEFAVRIGLGEAAGEKVAGSCESAELQRPFGTLMAHGLKLCRAMPADDSKRVRLGSDFIHNGCVWQGCAAASAD